MPYAARSPPRAPTVLVVTDDIGTGADRYLRERANRPFGDTESVSGRALHQFSQAQQAAAENLLRKALRALVSGDDDRALKYVTRAVALPFDDHEQVRPAAWQAHMMLFDGVVDELEESAEGDQSWLDGALQVLHEVPAPGRVEMRHVLQDCADDYDLEPAELHRIRAALKAVPAEPKLADQPDLSDEVLQERVMEVLRVYLAYIDALESE